MENEQRPIVQACSVNGEICRNGKRDDFKVDPLTNEKYYCHKWVKLVGKDPQTGHDIDTWCCNEFAKIKLALENANMTRGVAYGLDRNNNTFFDALPDVAKERVMNSNSYKIPNVITNGTINRGDNNGVQT